MDAEVFYPQCKHRYWCYSLSKVQAKLNYNVALGKTGEFDSVGAAAKELGSAKFNAWQVSLAYFF